MSNLRYPFLDLKDANAPYFEELTQAAERVIKSGRYVGGIENEAFEKELAAHTGTEYAVGVSNGLDALRLIFRALIELGRLDKGDAVIVPANTYIASVLAVTDAGLRPVLVEPDPDTLNINTSLLEGAYTPAVKAILTVHLYGRVAFDAEMKAFAERHKLIIVEDNAQAIGADAPVAGLGGSTRTGALGHAAAFSFYPTKNLGALGDAGAVTTDDAEIAAAVRALANYGSDRRYHNIYQGFNCRLDPIQAAMLRVKLRHLDGETARRRQLAAIYDARIDNPEVVKPRIDSPDGAVWHQYTVLTEYRDAFRKFLEEKGVGTDVHYAVPPHMQPCYRDLADKPLPVTELLARTIVSLPTGANITPEAAAEIADIINGYSE